jgi:hypothetical protein
MLALCRPEFCDAILCIDGSPNYSSTSSLKEHVRQVEVADSNVAWELAIYRIKPPALWIDDELLGRILESINRSSEDMSRRSAMRKLLQWTNPLGMSTKHVFSAADTFLSPRPSLYITPKGYASLKTWHPKVLSSAECDVQMIFMCMKRLFPSAAYVSTTLSLDVWRIPDPTSKSAVGTIQRAYQLAWAKTARKKILESNRKRLSQWLDACDSDLLHRIQIGLYGCSVFIPLPEGLALESTSSASSTAENDSLKGIALDATSDYIVFRVISSYESGASIKAKTAQISVTGVFKEQEQEFMDVLFSQCFIRPFDPRPRLSFSDLTQEQLIELQRTASLSSIPLPSGWWYNGDVYVDIHGTRRSIRPDVEELVQAHLAQRNSEIDRYNQFMSEQYP